MSKFNINKVSSGSVGIQVLPTKEEDKPKKPKEKPTGTRPSWIEYYMGIAHAVAARSTCLRRKVGCVIVKDKQVISAGYNGSPSKRKSCIDYKFCYRDLKGIESGTRLEVCLSAGAHAEQNSISQASKHGVSTDDADLFLIGHRFCCDSCKAIIINSGIRTVYLVETLGDPITVINVGRDWMKHPLENEPEYKNCKGCR